MALRKAFSFLTDSVTRATPGSPLYGSCLQHSRPNLMTYSKVNNMAGRANSSFLPMENPSSTGIFMRKSLQLLPRRLTYTKLFVMSMANSYNGFQRRYYMVDNLKGIQPGDVHCYEKFSRFLTVGNNVSYNAMRKTLVTDSAAPFYFDTHKLVKNLEVRGFTLEQAEALTTSFADIVNSSSSAMGQHMVTRNEMNQLELKMNAIVEALRKDMVILEKSEFLLLKGENEKVKSEVVQLNRTLQDELLKIRSAITLDMSLEKGRAREDHTLQDQRIKDTNNRIDTEIARVRTDLEAQKLDLIKYLVGCSLSIVTIMVGVWRFLKS